MSDLLFRTRARLLVNSVIRPVLWHLTSYRDWMGSEAAIFHMFAIAVHESAGLRFTRQMVEGGGYGRARSLFQIEPATFDDVLKRIIIPRKELWQAVQEIAPPDFMSAPSNSRLEALRWNQHLACAIARCRLLDHPGPIPAIDEESWVHAEAWLLAYNRTRGAERPKRMESFIKSFESYVLPMKRELFGGVA